jgi:hypothetical protein
MKYVKLYEQWKQSKNANQRVYEEEANLDNKLGSVSLSSPDEEMQTIKNIDASDIATISQFQGLDGKKQAAFLYKMLIGSLKKYIESTDEKIKVHLTIDGETKKGGLIVGTDDTKTAAVYILPAIASQEDVKKKISNLNVQVMRVPPGRNLDLIDTKRSYETTLGAIAKYFSENSEDLSSKFISGNTNLDALASTMGKAKDDSAFSMSSYIAQISDNFESMTNSNNFAPKETKVNP